MILDSWNSRYIDGLPFVSITYPYNNHDALFIENLQIDMLVRYIREKNITKVFLNGLSKFDFIRNCDSIKHLAIEFRLPKFMISKLRKKGTRFIAEYDLSPLYDLCNLKSIDLRDNEEPIVNLALGLDVSRFTGLEALYCDYKYIKGLENASLLKSLSLSGYNTKNKNLMDLNRLEFIDTIKLSRSSILSLKGIENFNNLTCLYLYNNRSLIDISYLKFVSKSLKTLRIDSCSKIEDFSVLQSLENLELLELTGNNKLPNLKFLSDMKNLKTFTFNMNVLDGELSLCKNLSYVYSEVDRKHYNFKDTDLPKGIYIRGNEEIEKWRRLE